MQALKVFRIFHPVEGTVKFVMAHSMAYTPAGYALYTNGEFMDKMVCGVPWGCGVEEVPTNNDHITLAQLQNAWRKGKIGLM